MLTSLILAAALGQCPGGACPTIPYQAAYRPAYVRRVVVAPQALAPAPPIVHPLTARRWVATASGRHVLGWTDPTTGMVLFYEHEQPR